MSLKLDRLAELAREDPGRRFHSIAHFLTPKMLYEACFSLRKDASAGVDGLTHAKYAQDAHENIRKLHERLKSKTYRAQPLRRIYIPKEDGSQRAISIPALEDKIVQKATADLLSAIYEQDFYECSYGFRPGRGAQDALDEVGRMICTQGTDYVVELDIASYFDSIVRELLMAMIERRISDASILRLIRKWISIGVIDEGRLLVNDTGTGQGQIISPLLANVYLHAVLDEWFEKEVKPRLKGKAFEVRYADDAALFFEYRDDAEKVLEVLPKRFAKFGLTLHPQKTRLIEFGRQTYWKARRAGVKPATFDLLGFTHLATLSRRGKFTVHVKTMRKRLRRSLNAVSEWCQTHRHDDVELQWKSLNAKLRGHYGYYGRSTNFRSLVQFYRGVRRVWRKWLNRRTRGKTLTWDEYRELLDRLPLLSPRITRRRVMR
jgi:group II intron reverse transcriptase/maturase